MFSPWLSRVLAYLKRQRFIKNVIFLQTGSFAGNIIQALAGVFMARLLQPDLFGVYALAFGLAGVASFFLGTGTHDAIAAVLGETYTQKDGKKTAEALTFLLKISLTAGLLACLGAFLIAPVAADFLYQNAKIGVYAVIIVLASAVSNSFFSITSMVLQVAGKIKAMTVWIVSDQAVRYGLSLLLVVLGLGVGGGVSGHLAGAAVMLIAAQFVWRWAGKKNEVLPAVRILWANFRKVPFKRYFNFSFWTSIDRNLASLYSVLPILLTGIFVRASEVSFFKLSFAYVNLALSLLAPISVLLNIEFPRLKIEDGRRLRKNFIRVSSCALGLSAVLTVAALAVAPWAFRFFYGESFMPSVKYVSGFLIYGALFGLGVGLGPMWRAVNRVKTSIKINLATLGAGIPLGLLLIKKFDVWGAVMTVTLWFTVSHFISFIYLSRILKENKNIEHLA